MQTGIRDLKTNLARYIQRVEGGESVSVTVDGRIVAELARPAGAGSSSPAASSI